MALLKPLSHGPTSFRAPIVAALCLGIAAISVLIPEVSSASPNEYQVKAVFLFNFAKFVEWPPSAFANTNTPLVIGVLGRDPFGSYLDDTVRGERVNHRPLLVQRFHNTEEIKQCHVLFISRSESHRLDEIVAGLKHRKILIVTDANGGNGGIAIRFVTDKNRIRFKIDPQAAKAANLVISSKLMRLG